MLRVCVFEVEIDFDGIGDGVSIRSHKCVWHTNKFRQHSAEQYSNTNINSYSTGTSYSQYIAKRDGSTPNRMFRLHTCATFYFLQRVFDDFRSSSPPRNVFTARTRPHRTYAHTARMTFTHMLSTKWRIHDLCVHMCTSCEHNWDSVRYLTCVHVYKEIKMVYFSYSIHIFHNSNQTK